MRPTPSARTPSPVAARGRRRTSPCPSRRSSSPCAATDIGLTPERRKILELTRDQYLSVAELSAHIKLPVGVVRVLVSDLSDSGNIRIHGAGALTATTAPATSLSVLESVLNGISSL